MEIKNGIKWTTTFDVLPVAIYDAILGMPFLKKHQAQLDCDTNTIRFPGIKYSIICDVPSQNRRTGATRFTPDDDEWLYEEPYGPDIGFTFKDQIQDNKKEINNLTERVKY